MSADALQYAPDKCVALNEVARALRPGGAFVFVVFELDRKRSAALPVLGTDPVEDYRPLLEDAGFIIRSYRETPHWWEKMKAAYEAIVAARTTIIEEMGHTAGHALLMEASLTLDARPSRRRVMVSFLRRRFFYLWRPYVWWRRLGCCSGAIRSLRSNLKTARSGTLRPVPSEAPGVRRWRAVPVKRAPPFRVRRSGKRAARRRR